MTRGQWWCFFSRIQVKGILLAEKRTFTVRNKLGIHVRPATLIVQTARQYAATIKISVGRGFIDGKSLVQLLTLNAPKGSHVDVVADGEDAHDALVAIGAFFERSFDEE